MLRFFTGAKSLFSGITPAVQATRNASYLGNLKPAEGAVKAYTRLGRGPASGKGKTAGRGQKGQKARGSVPHWLEGGQTPYYKLFPIVGFKRPHRKIYQEISLHRIQGFWNAGRIPLEAGGTLTIRAMRECGLLSGSLKDGVKILGTGDSFYNVPLNVEACQGTTRAIAAVRKTGHEFTSVYFTKLGLLAHVFPERFLLKKGRVPLQARPLHKRDIAYYSDPARGGYLLKDRSLLLDHVGKPNLRKAAVEKSALEALLATALTKTHTDYAESKIVRLADLKL
ncbi:ribosomal protein L15 [Metschnikowia bicuspidata var. bicuspidata NRRL YB-4993]|uniref:Ribosomal protein L15 n=1 Tax=Metschnikowia bicuspidata var. bicuspidata NRRL YB-4993 TaxID=869754 RepID=A0A1A0HK12_9ASCO|nr:ribosomal protein L15 [Metschnikowia bicuspidata var. bicuspidata NRRL YB-4993]OBA24341.1 ribosomal protein L15 [Metschnikowia bicuspidata var. bicuspidata NRRL YB-4993]